MQAFLCVRVAELRLLLLLLLPLSFSNCRGLSFPCPPRYRFPPRFCSQTYSGFIWGFVKFLSGSKLKQQYFICKIRTDGRGKKPRLFKRNGATRLVLKKSRQTFFPFPWGVVLVRQIFFCVKRKEQ